MHPHDEAIARVFLSLSIVNFTFTFAGVETPTTHEMRVDFGDRGRGHDGGVGEGAYAVGGFAELLGRPSTAGHLHSRSDIAPAQSLNERADPEDPEANKFFNKELKRKMMEYLIMGSIAGVLIGIGNGIQKEVMGTVSPGAQTVGRAVEPLDEHTGDQEVLVSRSLSNMGDEELEMLSFISRRMLNSLD